MAKKIKTIVKIQIPAGAATAQPPVGTALSSYGLNIDDNVPNVKFCLLSDPTS